MSLIAKFPTLNSNSTQWLIDSWCTNHFTFYLTSFTSYETISPTILDLEAYSTDQTDSQGSVSLQDFIHYKVVNSLLKCFQHVPDIRNQLLSVSNIVKIEIQKTFVAYATLTRVAGGNKIATGSLSNGMYLLNKMYSTPINTYLISNISPCNQRLSHVSPEGI